MGDFAQSYAGYADPFDVSEPEFARAIGDGDPTPGAIQTSPMAPVPVTERVPVSEDTDSLTTATVRKMCEYIQKGARDPHVQKCAHYAIQRFGRSAYGNPEVSAWSVFWFLKHRVRRVLDEGNGIRLDETNAADILIAPDVLLRMQDPAEDCDGFTMAAAALLCELGIENQIATVACDVSDRDRFSHVFNLVRLANGEWMPLDCSHGPRPGWMVPGPRVTRWQAWDLGGNHSSTQMPRSPFGRYVGLGQLLRVPRRRRGVGQTDMSSLPDTGDYGFELSFPDVVGSDTSTMIPLTTDVSGPGSGGTLYTGASTTSSTLNNSGLTNNQIASLIGGALTDATRVASIAELPSGASLTSTGQVIGSTLNTILPLLLMAGAAVLLISLVESAGHK